MPCSTCNKIEVRTGLFTVDRGDAGDPLDMGNVNVLTYGYVAEKHKILDPTRNVTKCTKEFYNALFMRVMLDCHSWEAFQKWLGITASVVGAATPNLPTDVAFTPGKDNIVYLQNELGNVYRGPYAGATFATTPNAGIPDLAEGTDYEFGDTDGGFIVTEADPSGIDGVPIFIQAGTYTTYASREFRFDDTAANTNAIYTYTHNLQNGKVFTIHFPTGFVVEPVEVTHNRDTLTEYEIYIESIWDASAVGYELGYWRMTT